MAINAAVIVLALLAMPAIAHSSEPTRADVQKAITARSYAPYAERDLATWRRDLQGALKRTTVDGAADTVAKRYGFASADMRRLVRAWIVAKSRHYSQDPGWANGVRAELYALAPAVRSKPLGLAILTEALDATTEYCLASDFDALMAGSVGPAADSYVIATVSSCTANFARAALTDGNRAIPALIRAAEYGGLPRRDVLPLYAWLTSPAALAHVRAEDRPAVSALLWQRYLTALFDAGMADRALAAFNALPAELRDAVVSPAPRQEIRAIIDRITVTFAGEGKGNGETDMATVLDDQADAVMKPPLTPPPKPESTRPEDRNLSWLDAPILQVAEGMAIAGRQDEARRLLATLPGLADARASLLCQFNATPVAKLPCARRDRLPMGALPLDHLLNTPDEDPYPIAETTLSSLGGLSRPASDAVLCRVFPKADYPDVCTDVVYDGYFSNTPTKPAELAVSEAALRRVVPGFEAFRASMLGADTVAPGPGAPARGRRATIAAIPPDFAEKPIPAEFLGVATSGAVTGIAPLPKGFILVRAERDEQRVVAISVSQTFDPTGEVSQGGYWVHLSQDGGQHWERPLYTGLSDRFPYVVAPSSRLPLIAGDTLQLAVDVSEIDTASITYPPLALRRRRQARNRFLTIPLDALRRDSNGDGMTDIAAHHLLLDRPKSAGGTPFVVGSDNTAKCRVPPSTEKLALIGLLGKIVSTSGSAIVEPIDRPAGRLTMDWRQAAAAADQPLFVAGRREDYTCLRSRRVVIIYDKADIDSINRFTPDFRALEMPNIVFDRSRDRGYVCWSKGWVGGTYRLRRVGDRWEFDSISDWVS